MLSRLDALFDVSSQEKLYDVNDLAELLKVSRRTIFTWKKQGLLPHSQVGGKIWVTEKQLKTFLELHAGHTEAGLKETQIYGHEIS